MSMEWLTQGQAPQNVTSTSAVQGTLPNWLAEYEKGIAGKALDVAGQGYTPYPGQRIAGFTPDQQAAFAQIRESQGAWKPELNTASSLASGIMPGVTAGLQQGSQYGASGVSSADNAAKMASMFAGGAGTNANKLAQNTLDSSMGFAQGAGDAANSAVAGPAQSWTNNWQQYMSPYTENVVNEIARSGNQNLMENIMPEVQSSFIGSGQFGSTRNADIMARAVRDAQTGISDKQSQALQSGYTTGANIFGQDAARAQQQQQMQSQTALGAGQLGANTAVSAGQLGANTAISSGQLGANTAIQGGSLTSGANLNAGQMANSGAQIGSNAALGASQQLGALGQMRQGLAQKDAQALNSVGGLEQQLNQQGLDTSYTDFTNQRDWDRNNLTWLQGLIKGIPVQQGQTTTTNAPLPGAEMGATGTAQIGAAMDVLKGSGIWDKLFP